MSSLVGNTIKVDIMSSLVGNTNCNRIGCRSKCNSNVSTIPSSLVDKIYRNADDGFCHEHTLEIKTFSNDAYDWEYDKVDGTIDFYSRQKTSRKNFGIPSSYFITYNIF